MVWTIPTLAGASAFGREPEAARGPGQGLGQTGRAKPWNSSCRVRSSGVCETGGPLAAALKPHPHHFGQSGAERLLSLGESRGRRSPSRTHVPRLPLAGEAGSEARRPFTRALVARPASRDRGFRAVRHRPAQPHRSTDPGYRSFATLRTVGCA